MMQSPRLSNERQALQSLQPCRLKANLAPPSQRQLNLWRHGANRRGFGLKPALPALRRLSWLQTPAPSPLLPLLKPETFDGGIKPLKAPANPSQGVRLPRALAPVKPWAKSLEEGLKGGLKEVIKGRERPLRGLPLNAELAGPLSHQAPSFLPPHTLTPRRLTTREREAAKGLAKGSAKQAAKKPPQADLNPGLPPFKASSPIEAPTPPSKKASSLASLSNLENQTMARHLQTLQQALQALQSKSRPSLKASSPPVAPFQARAFLDKPWFQPIFRP